MLLLGASNGTGNNRARDMPERLAVGPGFETEDDLRNFLQNEVETIRTKNNAVAPFEPDDE